jgi:hypothetical protein
MEDVLASADAGHLNRTPSAPPSTFITTSSSLLITCPFFDRHQLHPIANNASTSVPFAH